MASSNKTAKLGLNQWLPGDKPVFDDHNRDNANIESKVMVKDDYTGSGITASVAKADKLTTPRTIALGGAVTSTGVQFDGGANVTLNVSNQLAQTMIAHNADVEGGVVRNIELHRADGIFAMSNSLLCYRK